MTPEDPAADGPDDDGIEMSEEVPDDGMEDAEETEEDDGGQPAFTGAVLLRLAVTLAGLAVYWFARWMSLPGVNALVVPEAARFFPDLAKMTRMLALGLMPLVTSFLLVELFAVLSSPGGRLRQDGLDGRARLDRYALALGLGIALIQGLGIAMFLPSITSPGGGTLVANPGPVFQLTTVLTLVAGTAGLYGLAMAISRWGLGNGICVILVFDLLWALLPYLLGKPLPLGSTVEPLTLVLVPLAVVVLLAVYFVKVERGEAETGDPGLPALPQGILPVLAVTAILPTLRLVHLLLPRGPDLAVPAWAETLMLLVFVPLLSWVAFQVFSGPQRVAADLAPNEAEEAAEASALSRRRLVPAAAVLTLGAAGLSAWQLWQPRLPLPLTFAGVAMVAAFALDLFDEARFIARNGPAASLLPLGNLFLARHLTRVLEDAGIPALPRARRFRGLFFFFFPLLKVDLLVPAGLLEEATEAILGEEVRVV